MKVRTRRSKVRARAVQNALVVNPFVSEAQRRACHAGAMPGVDCDEWGAKTGDKKLPRRKGVRNARRARKVDPSRTITLRKAHVADLRRRFSALRKAVYMLVAVEDAFGLDGSLPFVGNSGGDFFATCERDEHGWCASAGGKLYDAAYTMPFDEASAAVKKLVDGQSKTRLSEIGKAMGQTRMTGTAAQMRARIVQMVEEMAASGERSRSWSLRQNIYCKTGPGGGVDPTCGKEGGGGNSGGGPKLGAVRPVHNPVFVGEKIQEAIAERPSRESHGDTGNNSFFIYDDGRVLAWDHPERKSRELRAAHMVHSHSGDGTGVEDLEFLPHNSSDVGILIDGLKKGDKTASTVIMKDGRMETLRISPTATDDQKKALGKLTKKQLKSDIDGTYEQASKAYKERGLKGGEFMRENLAAFSQHYGLEYTLGNWKTGESSKVQAPDWYWKAVGKTPPTANAGRFAFRTSQEKVQAFQEWLRQQVTTVLTSQRDADVWRRYAEAGYRKGAGRAFDDARKVEKGRKDAEGRAERHAGAREEFLRSSFARPVAVEKVKLLAGRAFDDLENVTDDMAARMSRSLADSLVQGRGAREAARALAADADVSQERAELIARTEIIRAHAEGQLDAMEQMGVAELGVEVEWRATDDNVVCPLCADMDGEVYTIEEARGMIPRHPNAVFAGSTFIPYGECEEIVRAWYCGPSVILTADGGRYRTTIGPNHPVMTRRGMVAAAEINERDEILYDARIDVARQTTSELDLKHVVLVERIYQSLLSPGNNTLVAASTSDLHGDRVFCKGEVKAISPKRGLLVVRDSEGVEQLREPNLLRPYADAELMPSPSARFAHAWRVYLPSPSGMRSSDARVATNFVWLKVHSVSFGKYEGYAFDSTTATSLYCSDGFVVSNCRCAFVPRLPDELTGNERVARFSRVLNIYCKTGEGGGVDPTCSSGGGASDYELAEGSTVKASEVVDAAKNLYARPTERNERGKIVIDGRTVLKNIDNIDSISASMEGDYKVIGIRSVPMSMFKHLGDRRASADDERKVQALVQKITESKKVSPLIVVDDGHPDGPYVLEGGHRADALARMGAKSFPALVVVDLDSIATRLVKGEQLAGRLAKR